MRRNKAEMGNRDSDRDGEDRAVRTARKRETGKGKARKSERESESETERYPTWRSQRSMRDESHKSDRVV